MLLRSVKKVVICIAHRRLYAPLMCFSSLTRTAGLTATKCSLQTQLCQVHSFMGNNSVCYRLTVTCMMPVCCCICQVFEPAADTASPGRDVNRNSSAATDEAPKRKKKKKKTAMTTSSQRASANEDATTAGEVGHNLHFCSLFLLMDCWWFVLFINAVLACSG